MNLDPPNSNPRRDDAFRAGADFSMTADLATLKRRSDILRQVRDFFYQRDFWEVETPLLSQESVIDLFLDPLEVPNPSGAGGTRYLQTSPEFGMKRMLASGAQAIFQVAKAFRSGESGHRHNPEFTMLEWYRCGDTYPEGRALLATFIETWLPGPCEQASFHIKFEQQVGLDPSFASTRQLWQQAHELGYASHLESDEEAHDSLARRNVLNFLWAELVEPHLGLGVPTIIYDWPASESALAQTATRITADGRSRNVAERFELYVDGIELANGYHELLDAEILQQRNMANQSARLQMGKSALPENSRLLSAMRHGFPDCCGVALGIDRLIMALLNKTHIDQVLTFPWNRA
jgi:elongation factor P--(R)-beta-lysine ligase